MRTLRVCQQTGEFELNGQQIGNYIEVRSVNATSIGIEHSLEHDSSNYEIVKWGTRVPPFKVRRLIILFDLESMQYCVVVDRPQWEPSIEV